MQDIFFILYYELMVRLFFLKFIETLHFTEKDSSVV